MRRDEVINSLYDQRRGLCYYTLRIINQFPINFVHCAVCSKLAVMSCLLACPAREQHTIATSEDTYSFAVNKCSRVLTRRQIPVEVDAWPQAGCHDLLSAKATEGLFCIFLSVLCWLALGL